MTSEYKRNASLIVEKTIYFKKTLSLLARYKLITKEPYVFKPPLRQQFLWIKAGKHNLITWYCYLNLDCIDD